MCIFYFLNPISESQRSQGLSEQERTFVCCVVYFVLALKHWKPLLLLIIIREACRWPRKQTSSSRWKDCRALHPFNLCKCKMYFVCVCWGGGTWDIILLCIKEVYDINSPMLFLCCNSNNLEEKFCLVFQRAAQTIIILDQSDSSSSWTSNVSI